MLRSELIEAGAQALYNMVEPGETQYRYSGDFQHITAAAVMDELEPLIRADEQERILEYAKTVESPLADLRAKVEALRGKWQRSVDRDPDGKLSGYDRAHVAALGDVLALIDGGKSD